MAARHNVLFVSTGNELGSVPVGRYAVSPLGDSTLSRDPSRHAVARSYRMEMGRLPLWPSQRPHPWRGCLRATRRGLLKPHSVQPSDPGVTFTDRNRMTSWTSKMIGSTMCSIDSTRVACRAHFSHEVRHLTPYPELVFANAVLVQLLVVLVSSGNGHWFSNCSGFAILFNMVVPSSEHAVKTPGLAAPTRTCSTTTRSGLTRASATRSSNHLHKARERSSARSGLVGS